ncbi:hypothetical protein [Mycolicibacterium sp.]|uniref:hypothetical protein n=1 Tax=Mycolicibacterium sp. TaxID=2320850 RepID=UPI003D0B43F9
MVVGALVVVVVLIAAPKYVWIGIGGAVCVVVVIGAIAVGVSVYQDRSSAKAKRERQQQAVQSAAEKKKQERRERRERQRRVKDLGARNADLTESALAAVKQIAESEAAVAGWLGDVDFTADIRSITQSFSKAHALRKVAGELSALDDPSDDDRKILAEAEATAADLERAAVQRVELIGRCATEAQLIDESLRDERDDARTAEQRAELHAKLRGMLYGIESAPDVAPADSTADAVMARVQAYREIKNQIQQARDGR